MKEYVKLHRQVYNELASEYAANFKYYSNFKSERKTLSPFIKTLKENFKKVHVLELGPGSGLDLADLIAAGFQTTAIDVAERIIEECRKVAPDANYLHGDFSEYDFKKSKFEGIFARGFIHLFPKKDAIKVLEKVKKLLVPNGIAFIGTTKHDLPEEGYMTKEGYSRKLKRYRKKWTENELKETLRELGFKIIYTGYHVEHDKNNKTWMFPIVQLPYKPKIY